MKHLPAYIFAIALGIMSAYYSLDVYAAMTEIPGTNGIREASIAVNSASGLGDKGLLDIGIRILSILKLVVSGFALIYLVMIGAWFILGSDSEETVKKQKRQIIYAIIAFVFLNVPGVVYQVFMPHTAGEKSVGTIDDWKTDGRILWNAAGFEGFFGNLIAFLRVFVFGSAVIMLTWGLFHLLISGGDDEQRKRAKNRIVYGSIALIFMGFVELWSRVIAIGDITRTIPGVAKQFIGLGLYLAAPVAIFTLAYGAYFYITSAGDEERAKKGKTIVINTLIAALILVAGLSFVTELINFQL